MLKTFMTKAGDLGFLDQVFLLVGVEPAGVGQDREVDPLQCAGHPHS
jgi:hypothetical protein